MPSHSFVQCDVFTDRAFGGNPLAVFPDGRGIDDATLQKIAREMNLSETVFVLPPSDPAQQELLELIGYDPVEMDTLIARSGLTPARVSSMLLIMEMRGLIEARPGGRYQRTS